MCSMNDPLGMRSKMYGRLIPRLGTNRSGVRTVRLDSYRHSRDLLVRKISRRGVGPTSGSFGFITISLKCFIRRRLRLASSRTRARSWGDIAAISPVIVKSSSFMAPILSPSDASRQQVGPRKGAKPPSELLDLEQAPDLHGEAHVPLQFQLAGHEGHLPGELAPGHVEPILRGHGEGEVRVGGGALAHVARAVLDHRVPGASLTAGDVVLDDGVDPGRLVGAEPGSHSVERLLHCRHGSLLLLRVVVRS